MGKNNFMTLMSQIFLAIILCAMTAGCSAVKASPIQDSPMQASPIQDSPMQTAEEVSEETASDGESLTSEINAKAQDVYVTEREIDFMFPYDLEGWSLVLRTEKNMQGEITHSLIIYDGSGNVAQAFDCPIEAERLTFRFDGLADYECQLYDQWEDLEVFAEDAAKTGAQGLLYVWDSRINAFAEEPIEIPYYTEARSGYYMVEQAEENRELKNIYYINVKTGEPVKLRDWELSWENGGQRTAWLRIEDCLEQAVIYEGEVEQYAPAYPVHKDYYDELLWQYMYRLYDYQPQEKITVSNMALSGKDEWDLTDYPPKEYESKDAVLSECGFKGKEPYYQYYDMLGRLELEMYLDEETGKGCGFLYSFNFNYALERIVSCYGFMFNGVQTKEWEDDTYSLLAYDGIDAAKLEDVTQVSCDYKDDGKLLSYEVRGVTDYADIIWNEQIHEESADESLLSIKWFYREDGTLYRRDYWHNSRVFGTSAQMQMTYYDELGRAAYRKEYITHGMVYYYYIYEGTGAKPKYCLMADEDLGEYYITMAVFQ